MRVRLLGVTASNLGEREQLSMFESGDPRQRRAIEAADSLRRRYGEGTVTGRGCSAPGCRRRSSGIRAIRWIGGARGVPVDADDAAASASRP
jgi:hypothetical protein